MTISKTISQALRVCITYANRGTARNPKIIVGGKDLLSLVGIEEGEKKPFNASSCTC